MLTTSEAELAHPSQDPLVIAEGARKKAQLLAPVISLLQYRHAQKDPDQSVAISEVPVDMPSVQIDPEEQQVIYKGRKKEDYPRGEDWKVGSACQFEPPATFFPSDGIGVEIAKRICATCVVKEPCLEFALAYRIDHGVWGGTSERQRRQILKKRR